MRRDAWQRERPADLPSRFPRVWVAGLLLAAATLNVAPPEALGRLRGLFLDSLRPGQLLVQNLSDRVRPLREIASAGSPADPIHAFEARIRELELEREQLRSRLTAVETWGRRPRGQNSQPVVIPELLTARWLGEELSLLWRSRGLLSVGNREGVHENALVVQSELPLVDVGNPQQVTVGNPVFAGRVVVGKIAAVGRQTSTVRRITDAGYSDRIRADQRNRWHPALADVLRNRHRGDTRPCRSGMAGHRATRRWFHASHQRGSPATRLERRRRPRELSTNKLTSRETDQSRN
jgi:cell shape-determining protein MreC